MGTVTGHVVCADTGRPARFALVALYAVPKSVTAAPEPGSVKTDEALAAAMKSMGDVNMVQTQTGLDGAFTAVNVAPGDYYAFAGVPGYVQPTSLVQAAYAAGADMAKPLAGVPVVHVAADRSQSVEISAERGAAVSGKVVWDDGSPVARAIVQVISPTGKEQPLPPQFSMLTMVSMLGGGLLFITDDRGVFRVSGLAPGSYDLKASLTTGQQFGMGASSTGLAGMGAVTPLVVYAPSSVHRADGKPVALKAGEELGDQEITFGLSRMRRVSGRVTAVDDHHGINSATVTLADASDKEFKRSARVDAQGRYTVDFVPAGTYDLSVTDAEDTKPAAKKGKGIFGNQPETVRSYEDGKTGVIVGDGDVTGKDVELSVDKSGGEKKPDFSKLLGGSRFNEQAGRFVGSASAVGGLYVQWTQAGWWRPGEFGVIRIWQRFGVSRGLVACGLVGGVLSAGGLQSGAQQAAPQLQVQTPAAATQVTGSVTGRVVCQDTQRPARFADVTLLPVQTASADGDDRFGGGGRRGSARTDLDGNYVVTNLPAGSYYATASATGYVSTMGAIAARATASADVATLVAQLPQVQVSGSGATTANLSLERGAVIAGRLMWDDGSAAAGVQVTATLNASTSLTNARRGPAGLGQFGFAGGGNGSFAQTDDRGAFRLTGLAPGDYVVRATFAAPAPAGAIVAGQGGFGGGGGFGGPGGGRTVAITLYAPGKMRKADAQVITLALGEERGDLVFTADLRALHSVAGRVSSASDTAVHSGSVRLVDSQDSTLSRNAQLNADGTFTVPYLPAGTYTMSVNASSATQGGGGRRGGTASASGSTPTVTFQPLQQTLTVADGDVAGVNLTVVPQTAASTGTTGQ